MSLNRRTGIVGFVLLAWRGVMERGMTYRGQRAGLATGIDQWN
jgi:hypothetical protein